MATCTAPIEGHTSPAAAESCPVHGVAGAPASGSMPPPQSTAAAQGDSEPDAVAKIDALRPEVDEVDAQLKALAERRTKLALDITIASIQATCPGVQAMRFVSSNAEGGYGDLSLEMQCGCLDDYGDEDAWWDRNQWWDESHVGECDDSAALDRSLPFLEERDLVLRGYLTITKNDDIFDDRGDRYVHSFFDAQAARLGIHRDNAPAITALRELPWWRLNADDREVEILRTMHANP